MNSSYIKITMLYWQYSYNRTFFLNEYWLFIPSALLANYILINKIRTNKAKEQELKELIEQVEYEKKIRKILFISLGLSLSMGYTPFFSRGGSSADLLNLIDTDYIRKKCEIQEGIRFLDDVRLRKIISNFYQHKKKAHIIYITSTALCHIANKYGQQHLALPFAVGDFGLTSWYHALRKALVTVLLGAVGPLWLLNAPSILIFILAAFGFRLAFNNVEIILTSPIDFTKKIKARLPGVSDVVVVNNRNNVIMPEFIKEKHECWLPDQQFLNKNCNVKNSEISVISDSPLPNLSYEDTVNMQDVTGLDRTQFRDTLDMGQRESTISKRLGKQVNFLDKFGDSEKIDRSEQWENSKNFLSAPNKNLRIRNEP